MQLVTSLAAILLTTAGSAYGYYDAEFTVYPNPDCSNGGGTSIFANTGSKSQFYPNQRSIRVTHIKNGKHLTLYLGGSQTGKATQFFDPDGCINGDWLSYGVYNGGP